LQGLASRLSSKQSGVEIPVSSMRWSIGGVVPTSPRSRSRFCFADRVGRLRILQRLRGDLTYVEPIDPTIVITVPHRRAADARTVEVDVGVCIRGLEERRFAARP